MMLLNILELWNSAWPASVIMLSLGGIFALVLLIAGEKLKVQVDPKIERICGMLPQIDCGACGFAGCNSYARAVAAKPDLIGKCAPGGSETSEKIAEILSLQVSASKFPVRPIVHCRAEIADKTSLGAYHGIKTCTAANAVAAVQACRFGCLGFGDCTDACKFDALHIEKGLAVVDYEKCTGCTACSKACPRNLIEMVPFSQSAMLTVACKNREAARAARSMCKVGCIGCKLCVKQSDIFSVENNLAAVDYQKYQPNEECETAIKKCPTSVIIYRGKTARHRSS